MNRTARIPGAIKLLIISIRNCYNCTCHKDTAAVHCRKKVFFGLLFDADFQNVYIGNVKTHELDVNLNARNIFYA
jgi:hypothetical protein